jgi:hypothetical protein
MQIALKAVFKKCLLEEKSWIVRHVALVRWWYENTSGDFGKRWYGTSMAEQCNTVVEVLREQKRGTTHLMTPWKKWTNWAALAIMSAGPVDQNVVRPYKVDFACGVDFEKPKGGVRRQ